MKCLKVEPNKINEILQKIETIIINLDENLKFKVMLICEEILTNQIKHTNFENRKPEIEICLNLKKNNFFLLFKDNAKEFNLLQREEPDITKSLEDTKIGGLGIFLVKKYSKSIDVKYTNGYNISKIYL